MYATRSRATYVSQSPVVTEFEYMLPLCSVNAFGMTTIMSFAAPEALNLSALSGSVARRPLNVSSRPL